MNFKRLFLSTIIIFVLNLFIGGFSCGFLFKWIYNIPPIVWLPQEEFLKMGNLFGSLFVGFFKAFFFCVVFAVIYDGVPKQGASKGIIYGILIWLIGSLVGIGFLAFFMTIAQVVIVYWIFQALVINIVSGAILGAIYRNKV